MPKFEWDETKRKANIKKHGIDFVDAPIIFSGYNTLTIEDNRYDMEKSALLHSGFWMAGWLRLLIQNPWN